jgi:hypothetical protein
MAAVLGYLAASGIAIVLTWLIAGRAYAPTRDESDDLARLGEKHVGIMGGLAGFAVTGMVLLVTLGSGLAEASSALYTTVLGMFFVAWMGYTAASFQCANIPESIPTSRLDVQGMAFAGAALTMYFTVIVGWFAISPLFELVGLTSLIDLSEILLAVAAIGGYGEVAQHLHRSGIATARMTVVIPALAVGGAAAYALIAASLGLRSDDSLLTLTITAFVIGAVLFALIGALPVLARQPSSTAFLVRSGQYLMLAYAQGVVVLVAFLLLAVLGLA